MSENDDNLEWLVASFLRMARDKQIALAHLRDSDNIGSSSPTTSKHDHSPVERQKVEVPMDYSDLVLSHDEWKAMLPPDKHQIVWRSASMDKQIPLDLSGDSDSIGSSSPTTSNHDHSPVERQKVDVPMDYSDLILSHDEWKSMLPPDKHEIVWRSASMGLFLDESTGKNCFIFGAIKLLLSHKLLSAEESVRHWERKAHAKSRFLEVAELVDSSSQFTIQARIHAEMLSPETSYAAYLVFELTENYKNLGFATSTVRFSDQDLISEQQTRIVHFQSGNSRGDGWTEVEMGSFYVHNGRNTEIEVTLVEPSGNTNMKSGLIVEGVEFRPSSGEGIFSKVRIS